MLKLQEELKEEGRGMVDSSDAWREKKGRNERLVKKTKERKRRKPTQRTRETDRKYKRKKVRRERDKKERNEKEREREGNFGWFVSAVLCLSVHA